MPLYAYRCSTCERRQDAFASVDMRHEAAPNCHGTMELEIMPAMVTPDIQPYIATAGDRAGQPITSRRQHREFLKRNRFVEVGNEPIKPTNEFRKIHTEADKRTLREQMKPVIREALRRGKA